ncbi:hypothetical protein niasHT_007515 [Heterodera trifolii]|uniref:Tudor domain-containing protein n=1 Tax=Heterodera trifolii TaxID=157864 RepID=A0ABD2LPD7_9BILA
MDDKSPAAIFAREFEHRQARDVDELRRIFHRHIEEESRSDEQQRHEKTAAPMLTTAPAMAAALPRCNGNSARIVRTPHIGTNARENGTASLSAITPIAAAFRWCTPLANTPTVSRLTLPFRTPCFVHISVHVNPGHFFVQLPSHPTFPSLALLNQYMLTVYTHIQPGVGAPGLAKPYDVGVLCAAPAYNGWFRAITLAYDQDQDEMLVRFVDYGGFARLPRADLRQIRTDFVTLPLQGIECYLANVQPADGSLHWSDKANELFQQLCVSKIIQAALVGYCKTDGIPCVELFVMDSANKKTVRIDQILLERGLAKPMEL